MSLFNQAKNKSYLFQCFQEYCPGKLAGIHSVTVKRFKEGRRALLEISALPSDATGQQQPITLYGKIRFKGMDQRTFTLNQHLYRHGFDAGSADGISVPEPIVQLSSLHMGVYARVQGESILNAFYTQHWEYYARKVVAVEEKLNQITFAIERNHTLDDELAILDDRLSQLMHRYPAWINRLLYLKYQCRHLADKLPCETLRCIHRDYYHDQILVNQRRMYVLDLDTCALGDPALDIGNFIAHLKEYALRTADFRALESKVSAVIEDEFLRQNPHVSAGQLRVYVFLSLVRLVFISHQLVARNGFTEALLELCEEYVLNINKGCAV